VATGTLDVVTCTGTEDTLDVSLEVFVSPPPDTVAVLNTLAGAFADTFPVTTITG
jgi:hypothetical protein